MNRTVVKRMICLALSITMLMISSSTFAFSSETPSANEVNEASVQPRWTYVLECDNLLEITEGESRKVNIYGSTLLYEGCAGVSVQLQKMTSDGRDWDNVSGKYWERTSTTDYVYVYDEAISLSSGTYRCVLEHSAYSSDDMLLESVILYSNTVTIY